MTTATITARRPSPGTAGLAALAVALIGPVLMVSLGVVGVLHSQLRSVRSLEVLDYFGPVFFDAVPRALWLFVPLAIGVFLSFWLVAPLRASLRLGQALQRSFVALVIGAVFGSVGTVIRTLAIGQPALADPAPGGGFDVRQLLYLLANALNTSITGFVWAFSLVLLCGVVLWNWLARNEAEGES